MTTATIRLTALAVLATVVAACVAAPLPEADVTRTQAVPPVAAPAAAPPPAPATGELPLVVVHRSPTCGCCGLWVEHMQEAGFIVEVRNTDDMSPVKDRLGVPDEERSCHTAEVDGYFVEGHVPAQDVKRMLAEKPKAKGLAVPGMPAGSPGMELPDGSRQPYTVDLIGQDGSSSVFASHGAAE